MIELEEEEKKEEKPKVSKQEQGFINAYGPNWREVLGYDDHTAKVALDDKGAPGSLLGDAVMLGLSFAAVKNPLKAVEAIGVDPENFNEFSLELTSQKASLNPGNLTFGKVKRLKTGVSRILDTTQTLLFGRKPAFEFATVNVDDGLFKSVINDITSTEFKSNNIFASISGQSKLIDELDNIPLDTVENQQLYDPDLVPVSREKGGYGDLGHQGLTNLGIDPNSNFAKLFRKLKAKQIEGPFKHHHVQDINFTGRALNTKDYKEVLAELNKLKIYPGDTPKNIIAMMDEGNLFLQTAKTNLAQQLRKANYPGFENIDNYGDLMKKVNKSQKELIDDLFKNPGLHVDKELTKGTRHPLTGEITKPEIRPLDQPFPGGSAINWKDSLGLDTKSLEFKNLPLKEQTRLRKEAWANRFKRIGIDRKSIKFDPKTMILSKDHIDIIHKSVYNSPKFTQRVELLKMIDDGSYYKLSAKQKAAKIAEVYTVQKNVSINVAKERLKLIKNHLKETQPIRYRDIYSKNPTELRKWIIDNPGTAANLGWKKGIPDYKTLTRDPGKISKELQTVFSTEIK